MLSHARTPEATSYFLGYLRGLITARFSDLHLYRGLHAIHMRALRHRDPDFQRGYRDALRGLPPQET